MSIDLAPPATSVDSVEYLIGDIRDKYRLRSVADGCEAILHLAAAHHDFGIDKETFRSVNVEGTRLVTEVASELSIKSICFYSSVAVYGDVEPPVSEDSEPKPVSDYGITKWNAGKRT